jgi:hypothetical protein
MGSITLQDVAIEHAMQQQDTGLVLDEVPSPSFFFFFFFFIYFLFFVVTMRLTRPMVLDTRFSASV